MKTRAKRASGDGSVTENNAATAGNDQGSKKPTLTVITNEGMSGPRPTVRPKVHIYPKRVKEAVKPGNPEVSRTPTLSLPAANDAEEIYDYEAELETDKPAASHFDKRTAIWLVALVVAVNLALLMLVGGPAKTATQAPLATTALPAAPATESGVMVRDGEPRLPAEETATTTVMKPGVKEIKLAPMVAAKPVAPAAVMAAQVRVAAKPVPVAKPVIVAMPVAATKPAQAAPAQDLLSIINQN